MRLDDPLDLPARRDFGRRDAASARLMLSLAGQIQCGRLHITLPDGRQRSFQGAQPGPSAALTVHRPRFIRRMLTGGATGFGEAYVDGDVDSPDLTALLDLTLANEAAFARVLQSRPWVRWLGHLAHRLRPNTRRGSRENIAAHYDLGNAFYAAWLDPTMTYSGAVFTAETPDLAAAQREKYRRIAALADLAPEHHVLEIGCGWGGFAIHAAQEIGCRVTAITISREQYLHARDRVAEAGLSERVEVAFCDYRDIAARYDRIVSIEMVEAVGESRWPTFFSQLHAALRPGGRAVLQAITIADSMFPTYRRGADFIQRHIFPGGMLLSPHHLGAQAENAGLTPGPFRRHGRDYAETLRRWRRNFEEAWPRIAGLDGAGIQSARAFDERFRRMWRYYLAYCEAGFHDGRLDLYQIAFDRPEQARGAP